MVKAAANIGIAYQRYKVMLINRGRTMEHTAQCLNYDMAIEQHLKIWGPFFQLFLRRNVIESPPQSDKPKLLEE